MITKEQEEQLLSLIHEVSNREADCRKVPGIHIHRYDEDINITLDGNVLDLEPGDE